MDHVLTPARTRERKRFRDRFWNPLERPRSRHTIAREQASAQSDLATGAPNRAHESAAIAASDLRRQDPRESLGISPSDPVHQVRDLTGNLGPKIPSTAAPDGSQGPPQTGGPTTDYWGKALERLAEDAPARKSLYEELQKKLSSPSGVIDNAVMIVTDQQKLMEDSEWTLPFIIREEKPKIRDWLGSVFNALHTFKDLGTTLTAADPSGIASLAWGCVTVVLEVAVSDYENHGDALEGLAKITPMITRYTEAELLYVQDDSKLKSQFEECLIAVYASILEYLVSLASYFRRWALTRFLRASVKGDDWQTLLDTIESRDKSFSDFAKIADAQQGKTTYKTLLSFVTKQERSVATTNQLLDDLLRSAEWKESRQILRWVSPASVGYTHQHTIDKTGLGTSHRKMGKWLFRKPAFLRWLNRPFWVISVPSCSANPITGAWNGQRYWSLRQMRQKPLHSPTLWLCGTVGTGKTVLTCLVIEWCLQRCRGRRDEIVVFFYCSKTEDSQLGSTSETVLRSLVRQLAKPPGSRSVSLDVKRAYEDGQSGGSFSEVLTLKQSLRLLQSLIQQFQHVTIILDAVDECSNPRELLRCLEGVMTKANGKIALFCSSLESVVMNQVFPRCHRIDIKPLDTFADLESYISKELQSADPRLLARESPDLTLETEVRQRLTAQADGMFLWVQLQLSILLHREPLYRNPQDVRIWLESLKTATMTPQLEPVYKKIYQKNTAPDRSDHADAVRTYKIMLECRQALKLVDLVEAVSRKSDGTIDANVTAPYVLDITQNFIIVDRRTQLVHFAHLSVVDFLHRTDLDDYGLDACVTELTETCLRFLLHPGDTVRRIGEAYLPSQQLSGFRSYVYLNWPVHFQSVDQHILGDAAARQDFDLLRKMVKFLYKKGEIDQPDGFPWGSWATTIMHLGPEYLAYRYGFDQEMLRKMYGIIRADRILVFFCLWDMPIFFRSILYQGTLATSTTSREINNATEAALMGLQDEGNNLLHIACQYGQLGAIGVLLEKTGERLLNLRNNFGATPLMMAVRSKSTEAVELVLKAKAEVSVADDRGWTALHHAASVPCASIMRLLLEAGLSALTLGVGGWTVLQILAQSTMGSDDDSAEVAELLMRESDAPWIINRRNNAGETALEWAMAQSNFALASILLKHGANIHILMSDGDTIFAAIILQGYTDVGEFMLKNGANVDEKGVGGMTALHRTSFGGHTEMVEWLLAHNANFELVDDVGATAIHWATMGGHVRIVQLLLKAGANIEVPAKGVAMRPLHVAARSQNIQIASLLLEGGANIFATTATEHDVIDLALNTDKSEGFISACWFAMRMARIQFQQASLGGFSQSSMNGYNSVHLQYPNGDILFSFPHPGSLAEFLFNNARDKLNRELLRQIEEGDVGETAAVVTIANGQTTDEASRRAAADARNDAVLSLIMRNYRVSRSALFG